jgi:23S rRNA (adenine2503-C2)-methyltransferase
MTMTATAPITQDVLTIPRKAPEGGRLNLVGLTRDGLRAALIEAGTPEKQAKMRAGQIWQWVYQKGVREFSAMTNLAKGYRAELEAAFDLTVPEVVSKQVSLDGTRKYLMRIAGGHEVEVVYIPEEDRGTLCISSQVGCTLTCSFCHTGTQKLVRNLTAGEIIGQVMVARDDLDEWPRPGEGSGERPRLISNIVLMGMGEPLYNFENVRDAMKIAMDGEGIAISRRRITLSTSGVVPEIARCAEEIGCMLAVSFHATTDEVRDRLVPINKRWNIRGPARCAPRLSQGVQFRANHVRIRDAERHQRQRRGRAAVGETDLGHSGEDQPDSVQRVARCALRTVGLGADRALRRYHLQGRLCLADPDAAGGGHHGRLRSAEVRDGTCAEVPGGDRRRNRHSDLTHDDLWV